MAEWKIIGGVGTPVGGGGSGGADPSNPIILSVSDIDGTPDASGQPRKHITVNYQAPSILGTFTGVWVYLDAPDTSNGLTVADGTVAADGTQGESGTFQPADIGFFAYDATSPQLSFDFKSPSVNEFWRVYLIPGSRTVHSNPIQHGQIGESVSHQFVVLPPATALTGREYAPLVQSPVLAPFASIGWTANPEQIQGESGDQAWHVCVTWTWPTDDQNYQALGGVNIVVDDGTTQVYIGNVDKGAPAQWSSAPQTLKPGTTHYTVYLISYDTSANNNSLFIGITPSAQFNVTRQLGSTGVEYAALVTSDGVHAFVTVVPVAGADGTAIMEVTAYWSPPADQRFGGVKLWVKKVSGSPIQIQTGARTSPLQVHLSQPASSQSWRFYLVSIDVNGNSNTIKDNGDGTHDAGETPWIDITVGNALGQLNLGAALASSFANDLAVSSGQLTLGNVSATKVVTGILQVGGGGSKVSIMKNFDTLGSLIGWVGDDTGTSGFVGAWFKQLRIGGASPSAAQITADSSGNVTISGSLVVGAVASANAVPASGVTSGTFVAGVNVPAGSIQAGTISASVLMTSPSIQVTSGTVVIKLNSTDLIKVTNSATGIVAQLGGTGVAISNTGGGPSTTLDWSGLSIIQSSNAVVTLGPNGANGQLNIYGSGLALKVQIGVSGSNGYIQFNNGSNYALWCGTNAHKIVYGTGGLSGGSLTVASGLSIILSACANIIGGGTGGGTPSEYLSVGATGGSVFIWSSNASSTVQVTYIIVGDA